MTQVNVYEIRDQSDRDAAIALSLEFFASIKARFPDRADTIETYIRDHNLADQMKRFEACFEPPAGRCFLAFVDEAAMGIVKLRPHGVDGAELNRMYVREAARGLGCGKLLVKALLAAAEADGYRYVYLDSLRRMVEAHRLYEKLGFQYETPADGYRLDDPDILHMMLHLSPVVDSDAT